MLVQNCLYVYLCSLPLVLSLDNTEMSLLRLYHSALSSSFLHMDRIPLSVLCSRPTSPSTPSLSSYVTLSSLFSTFVFLLDLSHCHHICLIPQSLDSVPAKQAHLSSVEQRESSPPSFCW